MTTKFNGPVAFEAMSIVGASIPVTSATSYTISDFSAADRALSATETDTATVAATVATMISDLTKKGVLSGTGGE